ncbi:hypothetical protein [Streptomyces parvulus]
MGRNLIALPAFYLISRAPLVAQIAAAVTTMTALGDKGQPFATGMVIVAVSFLAAFAVHLITFAPLLRTTNGKRRAISDACWEKAEGVADWAGWEFVETPDTDARR